LRGRFTARTTVTKDVPARSSHANVLGALSFVIAVIPLGQVGFNLGRRREPDQLAGPPRAPPRTGQHTTKLGRPQPWSKFARLGFAFRGQRNIRSTGMLAGERPRGSAVSNEIKLQERILGGNQFAFAMSSSAVSLGTPVVALTSFPSRRCIRRGAQPCCSWLDDREPSGPPEHLPARPSISPRPVAEWRARTKTPEPKAVATPPL